MCVSREGWYSSRGWMGWLQLAGWRSGSRAGPHPLWPLRHLMTEGGSLATGRPTLWANLHLAPSRRQNLEGKGGARGGRNQTHFPALGDNFRSVSWSLDTSSQGFKLQGTDFCLFFFVLFCFYWFTAIAPALCRLSMIFCYCSIAKSCPILGPHGLQRTRLPCPSLTPGVCSNSCPSGQGCHPTISSSVIAFSSCLQTFPASGSFPMSQFFASGGPSIGVSTSASILPMNIQDWFPLGLTSLISLQSKGFLTVFSKRIFNWKPGYHSLAKLT